MIVEALLYYVFNSWKNNLIVRLKRLRQPKYLLGGLVGRLYMWFAFLQPMVMGHPSRSASGIPAEFHDLAISIAALAGTVFILLAWVLPHERASLTFSEAEAAFLFPAPISRKTLIHFKLCKSQLGILFSALIFSLIGKSIGGGSFAVRVLGWWIVLSTINLHLLGSSFARTMLMDHGVSSRVRRIAVLAMAAVVMAVVLVWGWQTFPSAQIEKLKDLSSIASYLRHVLESGPLPYLLYPFKLIVRPYMAANAHDGLLALPPALAIMVLHYIWVIRSNVAFEESSLDASRKMAERITAMRSGNWAAAAKNAKPRRDPFRLKPVGMPAIALLWKNLVSAGTMFTSRIWLILLIYLTVFSFAMGGIARQENGLRAVITFIACFLVGFSFFMGPQVLRQDLRQDLLVTDILKQYPMPGWQIVFGEILTPVVILTAVQWLLIIVGGVFCPAKMIDLEFTFGLRIAICLGAGILLPFFNLVALSIPNTAVLIFPAWFQFGKDAARGFETIGQQMILFFGQLLVFVAVLLPAIVVGGLVFFVANFLAGNIVALLATSLATAMVLALEALVLFRSLGKRFERFDLSAELKNS